MYKNFFSLRESPFTIAPDPRYLYMSERHREALAHLLYGFKYDGGFVLLTGEVGTGKTTVCRCLLEQIPSETDVALIFNPCLSGPELLAAICQEFSIEVPFTDSSKQLIDHINHFLLDCNQKGRKAVLVLDEAQNLSCEVLEQIRLLTNLETNTRKLLQVIMLGQPELLETLDLPEMRQLAQRITARYHLEPLSEGEVKEYVRHRWKVAGGTGDLLDDRQSKRLYALSKGIPRVINVICDRMLLGAYSQDAKQISMAILEQGASEVTGKFRIKSKRALRNRTASGFWAALVVIVILFVSYFSWVYLSGQKTSPTASVEPAAESPAPATNPAQPFPVAVPPAAETGPVDAAVSVAEKPSSLVGPAVDRDKDGVSLDKQTPETVAEKSSGPGESMVWKMKDNLEASGRYAFADLFLLWGLTFPPSEPYACNFADQSGLKCLFKKGNLKNIYDINRPAVLEMVSDDHKKFSAALVRFDRKNAILIVNGRQRLTTAEQIARHWNGNFILLWKPPPGYTESIRPGSGGETENWLSERLAVFGIPAVNSRSASAEELSRRIMEFQRKAGLNPDGIAGVQTIIRLNSRTDKAVPRLHDEVQ